MTPHQIAVERVTRLGAITTRPTVDPGDIDTILESCALPDSTGRAPGTMGWVPTYDTNAAIAEVWRTKAGLVAGDFTFTADDLTVSKGDLLAHMLAMETKYAQMAIADATTRAAPYSASTLDIASPYGQNALDTIARTVIP